MNNNFTLLRLILAVMVALEHFRLLPTMTPITHFSIYVYGEFAVDAFFIISGFLITTSFDRQPQIGAFYIRRFFRIYPLYAFVVLAQGLAMAALLPDGISAHIGDVIQYLGLNLVFANFLHYDVGGLLAHLPNPGINPSLWTLKIEIGFYLILPLLWRLTQRYGVSFLILLYAASTLYAEICLHHDHEILARQLPGQLRFFAVGMALYRYQDSFKFSVPWAVISAIVLFLVCSIACQTPLLTLYPLFVGGFVFICALCMPPIPFRRDISYGVYLFHGPLIQFSVLLGFQGNSLSLAAILSATFALAIAAEYLVERPGIVLGKRLSNRLTRPGLPQPAEVAS